MKLGAKGYIDRRKFDHWGRLPDWQDEEAMTSSPGLPRLRQGDLGHPRRAPQPAHRLRAPRRGHDPDLDLRLRHGGMVVICAGTTGYNADVDLRYLWTRQKRLQGSHFANDDEARAVNDLVAAGKIDPCLTRDLRLRRDRPRAPAAVREPPPQRQHGGARRRARFRRDNTRQGNDTTSPGT